MISEVRKIELCKMAQYVLVDLPQVIKGNDSLAQEILNRIEAIAQGVYEYQYMVDVITVMVEKSKGKEVQVAYKGKILNKEQLATGFGVFLAPKNKTIFGK